MVDDIASRTLELLSLLRSRQEWTGSDLAERLGVTSRTVRRDIERLRRMGYEVTARRGAAGSYRLARGDELPPLLLGDEEVIAVALALQTAPTSVAGAHESSASALASIRALLPARLSRRLDSVSVAVMENPWELAPPVVSSRALSTLSSAAEQRDVVIFRTATDEPGTEPERVTAEPYRVVVWSGRWHLVAYDQQRDRWRSFRVDRLRDLRLPGWRFARREPPADDVLTFVQQQPGRGDPADAWPCTGTVVMDCPAPLVARWAPAGASVEVVDAERSRIIMGAWSWAGLVGLLLTFDADFVVEGPRELDEACAALGTRLERTGAAPRSARRP